MAEPKLKSEQNKTRSIRKVKNPQTFRERALKVSHQSQQTKPTHRLGAIVKKPITPVVKMGRKVGQNKFVRIISWPLRLLAKILFPKFLRSSYQELRMVKWPNGRESRQLTFAVLVFAVVFGVIVAVVDYGLDKLFREVLLK